MVFVLIFAAAHMVQHNLDIFNGDPELHSDCQICRLNHVPVASTGIPSLISPLQLLTDRILIENLFFQLAILNHYQKARAPPLF